MSTVPQCRLCRNTGTTGTKSPQPHVFLRRPRPALLRRETTPGATPKVQHLYTRAMHQNKTKPPHEHTTDTKRPESKLDTTTPFPTGQGFRINPNLTGKPPCHALVTVGTLLCRHSKTPLTGTERDQNKFNKKRARSAFAPSQFPRCPPQR